MKYLKWILTIIVFTLFFVPAKSQSDDECRYLVVLTYLRTNEQINGRIKKVYSKMNLAKKKNKFVEFNLSGRIDFLGIYDFKNDLSSKNFGVDNELINNPKLYYENYFFESFRSEFLNKLVEPNESKLFLTFSKPIDNYLIVELLSTNPELHDKSKMGLGMKIFFKFDSLGLVEDVLFSIAAHN